MYNLRIRDERAEKLVNKYWENDSLCRKDLVEMLEYYEEIVEKERQQNKNDTE
jgi:hypothetical protein